MAKDPIVAELEAAIDRCNGCGFCQAGCPVYKVTGIEWTVARGRVSLLRNALQGRLPLDEGIREPMFNCLTCGGCVDHCPPGVATDKIVTKARQVLVRRQGLPWVQRLLFGAVLPHPTLLSSAFRLLWLAQVARLAAAAQETGVTRLLGLADAADVLPTLAPHTGRTEAEAALRPLERPTLKVAYFLGCGTNNVFPGVARATVRVLQRQGVAVVVPAVVCCGKPPLAYGDAESARLLARRNVDALAALDVDAVVTDCATCGSFLREYGELLADDAAYAERAKMLAGKVRDVLALLSEVADGRGWGRFEAKVTYHDPCHLGRFQKVTKPPRDLLQAIAGLTYVELAEANMCCGGAGSYSLTHYDISMKVLDRKMANVARTGAQVLATACPGCAMQLSHGLQRSGVPARVAHVIELLDEAYDTQR